MADDAGTMQVPPGRYWIAEVGDTAIKAFRDWTVRHREDVRIEFTEYDKGESSWLLPNRPPTEFTIFNVQREVPWDTPPGLPSWAGTEVKSKDDTVQRPPPAKDPIDALTDATSDMKAWLLLGLLYLWSKR